MQKDSNCSTKFGVSAATLDTWIRESVARKSKADWMAVCSDRDIEDTDAAVMSNLDLGIRVDTSPKVISDFLKEIEWKEDQATYQSRRF